MRTIIFRPLRRIKKTGKITIASYMQWRKIKTADYSNFKLVIDTEYKTLPLDEYVFNHKGENLFWWDYNPEKIPTITGHELKDGERFYPDQWKTTYDMYSAKGLDCDGVPTFSHYTANKIINNNPDLTEFEPLTVATVTKWFGWFLYKLQNNETTFKGSPADK